MAKPVLLDNVAHQDLRVNIQHSEAFGDGVNQALVFPTEFMELQREYPIIIRKSDDGDFYAVVLLGLDRDENLFLSEEGWNARYIPAIQERGPFSISLRENEVDGQMQVEPLINVDMEHPRICTNGGESVFLPHGGHSPYLESVTRVLKRIHVGAGAAKAFFTSLNEMNLIEPITLEIKLSDSEQYTVPDIYTISREKMASLSGENLAKLNSLGLLEHCYAIMASAGNVSRLIELKTIKRHQSA